MIKALEAPEIVSNREKVSNIGQFHQKVADTGLPGSNKGAFTILAGASQPGFGAIDITAALPG